MSHTPIRRLRAFDLPKIRKHFQRLDPDTLRLRFHRGIKPSVVQAYADHIFDHGGHFYGAFVGNHLRGLAEMRPADGSTRHTHEVALTVESGFQDHGIGSDLLSRLMTVARNRGIRSLQLSCLSDNERMVHLARHHDAHLSFEYGQFTAELTPAPGTYLSVAQELAGETRAYANLLADVATHPGRLVRLGGFAHR